MKNMKTPSSLHFPIHHLLVIFWYGSVLVQSRCLEDQQTLLLQLKSSLKFNPSFSTKLVRWNQSAECCCDWAGVACDNAGHVTSLDLSMESITSVLDRSSSLFQLQYLQSLNLAYNDFKLAQVPSRFKQLTGLTYLNLSNSNFSGQIPAELSSMTRLVTLDLSDYPFPPGLKLYIPNLSTLLMNLTRLTQLYLDGVNISTNRYSWGQTISSSLPNLKVLSLSDCQLSGPLDSSLVKLQFLSELSIRGNNLNAPVPDFLASFKNLAVLNLGFCNLYGTFPENILSLPTLKTLDLLNNGLLEGSLHKIPQNSSLQTLVLSNTNFSGSLAADSIGNLGKLARVELNDCSFSGPIPNSFANLTQLVFLDMSSNMFTGSIPSFQKSENLVHIDLARNNLSGPIPSNHFEGLHSLVYVDLRFNAFTQRIPSSLFSLSSLEAIRLSNNRFDGLLAEFFNASSSALHELDLSRNKLEGPIPMSLFELQRLHVLSLSFNNLNGTIQLETFQKLRILFSLDLSYNNLSIETSSGNSVFSPTQSISTLRLASCKLQEVPNLRNHTTLFELDLADNQIVGEIPNWIWESEFLSNLNLSYNLLEKFQEPYRLPPSLNVLDLQANQLSGKFPIPPEFATYVDYSANHFNSSLPTDIGNNLNYAYFFSVSRNRLTGTIPDSLCKASYLKVLDLSYNHLSGMIPSCFAELTNALGVLNLGMNNLTGIVPGIFQRTCGLQTLDLHGNLLKGKIPGSLSNCSMLEVLNLGNNLIADNFPCFLKNCSNLHVLILRSNMLEGGIQCSGTAKVWPKLQIFDIASNYFTGNLPWNFFSNWRAMMKVEGDEHSGLNHLRFKSLQLSDLYYEDKVTITNKGLEMELVKILTIFTSIDISNNGFSGEIPSNIGELKALYVLNFSRNALTGSIPASIGNLRELGSLDLSVNNLTGEIPSELVSLTFLSFLNLSNNQLDGKIPSGSQFETFAETSFAGNKGLCGFPLSVNCNNVEEVPGLSPLPFRVDVDQEDEINSIYYISAAIGFVAGLGTVVAPLVFCKRLSKWYYKHVDRIFAPKLHQYCERRNRERRAYRNPIRRLQ